MSSTIQICNLALGRIGARGIASLEERTPEAIYCKQFYDLALDQTLRDHRWNFAQKRVVLAGIDVPEGWTDSWEYAYAVPSDCLHAHTIVGADGSDKDTSTGAPWEFVLALANDSTRVILTNVQNARLGYTVRVADASLFDPWFVRALEHRLAADLVGPVLKNNPGKIQETEQLYARAIAQARLHDAREGRPEETPESDWITARTRY